MIVLTTTYKGPDDSRGARVRVRQTDRDNRVQSGLTVSWDYALDPADNHLRAAQLWAEKCGLLGPVVLLDGRPTGYVVGVGE